MKKRKHIAGLEELCEEQAFKGKVRGNKTLNKEYRRDFRHLVNHQMMALEEFYL